MLKRHLVGDEVRNLLQAVYKVYQAVYLLGTCKIALSEIAGQSSCDKDLSFHVMGRNRLMQRCYTLVYVAEVVVLQSQYHTQNLECAILCDLVWL